ncbi:MAG TPA: hypothetical protein VLJ39_01560 [Tepidisphaeraceae bacterium]|jgi:hypothetical protein|nr:hypothetical protein [Tepidisphaeraceae bacterium]
MNDLNELASIARARQAAEASAPPPPKKSNVAGILIVAGVVLVLIILGAVLLHSAGAPGSAPQQQSAGEPASGADREEARREAAAQAAKASAAMHERFNEFALRLCESLGISHRAALQNAAVQSGDVYSCVCQLRRTEVVPASPKTCKLTIGETVTADDGSNTVSNTYQIAATFNELEDRSWKPVVATSKLTAHTGTADLFKDPVALGQEREITHIDWFHAAVASAQRR